VKKKVGISVESGYSLYTEIENTRETKMNNIYKTYDPEGNALVFESLAEIANALDLNADDRRKVFYPGVHTTINGDKVITY